MKQLLARIKAWFDKTVPVMEPQYTMFFDITAGLEEFWAMGYWRGGTTELFVIEALRLEAQGHSKAALAALHDIVPESDWRRICLKARAVAEQNFYNH